MFALSWSSFKRVDYQVSNVSLFAHSCSIRILNFEFPREKVIESHKFERRELTWFVRKMNIALMVPGTYAT